MLGASGSSDGIIVSGSGTGRATDPMQVVSAKVAAGDTPVLLYRVTSAIGDYVWNDGNRNGIQDDGDTGINGVTVNLYDCAGNPVASTR